MSTTVNRACSCGHVHNSSCSSLFFFKAQETTQELPIFQEKNSIISFCGHCFISKCKIQFDCPNNKQWCEGMCEDSCSADYHTLAHLPWHSRWERVPEQPGLWQRFLPQHPGQLPLHLPQRLQLWADERRLRGRQRMLAHAEPLQLRLRQHRRRVPVRLPTGLLQGRTRVSPDNGFHVDL